MLTQLHEEFLDLAGADVPALEVLRIHAQRVVGDGALGARELLPVFEAAQARWMGSVGERGVGAVLGSWRTYESSRYTGTDRRWCARRAWRGRLGSRLGC
jgi:hypothetical protein